MLNNQKLNKVEEAQERRDLRIIQSWFSIRAFGYNPTLESLVKAEFQHSLSEIPK